MAFEYTVNGKIISLPVDPKSVAVRFSEPSGTADRRAAIEPTPEVGSFDERYEVPNEKLTIVPLAQPDDRTGTAVNAAFAALRGTAGVDQVNPVFAIGSKQVVVPNRVIVGFKSDSSAVTQILDSFGGKVLERLGTGNEYVVQLPLDISPFDVAQDLTKNTEVSYAEPDFVAIGSHLARPKSEADDAAGGGENKAEIDQPEDAFAIAPAFAGDPFLKFKYAARKVKADQAWQIVEGSPDIKIAILDDGVYGKHPDLSPAIAGVFDAVTGNPNNPNSWDGHGTACAGLACARPSGQIGIRGMSGGCSLLAVRIASSTKAGAKWTVSQANVVRGIEWARDKGADVLSNSWGSGLPSTAIFNALERARLEGRNGKGCVIVVAAGNDSGAVDFPANQPDVLAVAASNEDDQPKTATSSDGESWWGSNFGPEIDLAAPGVHNFTTAIAPATNSGNKFLPGEYLKDFNGTSSATPIVAGIAGLVLSVNPDLTEGQVRCLLKETADKVGSVIYTDGRNNQMGHGRVNALRAVTAASTFNDNC
ncbi:MAG TPA: S8 family serine peptidase [Pyrinomonadaceae bacterium]|nr:S8 family serine peptidase [Pyrinomonadaceae bacterium]